MNVSENKEKCKECGAESDVGCHGLKDGVVHSEYYCETCFFKKKRERNKKALGPKT